MKHSTKKRLIYIRYIAPVILAAVLLLCALIPCYRFAVAGKLEGAVSLLELCSNSFSAARSSLFGTAQTDAAILSFSRILLFLVCVLCLLFLLGAASAVYALVRFIRFSRGDRTSRAHVLFLTLTANRILLCVYHALMLPLLFLPHLMPFLYRTVLGYEVALFTQPFDMLFITLPLTLAVLTLVIISAKFEPVEELNLYTKLQAPEVEGTPKDEPEEVEAEDEPTDAYEQILRRAKEEQAARILGLLNKDDKEEKK